MTVLTTIYLITAFLVLLFIVSYMPRYWWTHPTGHAIMATKVAIFLMSLGVIATVSEHVMGEALLAASGILMSLVLVLCLILLFTVSRTEPPPDSSVDDEASTPPFPTSETSEED